MVIGSIYLQGPEAWDPGTRHSPCFGRQAEAGLEGKLRDLEIDKCSGRTHAALKDMYEANNMHVHSGTFLGKEPICQVGQAKIGENREYW